MSEDDLTPFGGCPHCEALRRRRDNFQRSELCAGGRCRYAEDIGSELPCVGECVYLQNQRLG